MNSSLGACRTLKDLDLRLIVGYSSKSMISYRVPNGYEGKKHGAKVKAIRSHVSDFLSGLKTGASYFIGLLMHLQYLHRLFPSVRGCECSS